MQAGRQRSSGWRRHADDVLKNTGPGMVVSPLYVIGSPPRTYLVGWRVFTPHGNGVHFTVSDPFDTRSSATNVPEHARAGKLVVSRISAVGST